MTDRTFFRREKAGLLGRRKWFCEACRPYVPTRKEKLSHVATLVGVFTLAFGGAMVIFAGFLGPRRDPALLVWVGYANLFHGVFMLASGPTLAIHELGHAAVARLVGMTVRKIVLGTGPLVLERRVGTVALELRSYLLNGGMTIADDGSTRPAKWRRALMLLGGVTANLVLGAVAVTAFAAFHNPGPLAVALGAVVLLQITTIWVNLVARQLHVGPSDGRRVLALLQAKDFRHTALMERALLVGTGLLAEQRFEAARRHYASAVQAFPTLRLFIMLVDSTARAQGARAAVQCYFDHSVALRRPMGDDEKRFARFAYAAVAWQAVLTGDPDLLPLADQLSRDALDVSPYPAMICATRGAVLCRLGHIAAGAQLLSDGLRALITPEAKAEYAAFLAEVARAGSRSTQADELERLARHFAARADLSEVSRFTRRRQHSVTLEVADREGVA